jgi:hypothetical protein
MLFLRTAAVGAVSIILGCSSGSEPSGGNPPDTVSFVVDSVRPVVSATDIELTDSIVVFFNRSADPATLTTGNITLTLNGVAVPFDLSYSVAAKALALRTPFLPASSYVIGVSTDVQDLPGGHGLKQALQGGFSTRAVKAGVADNAADVGYRSTIMVDGAGQKHVAYGAGSSGIKYATCATACEVTSNWQTATLPGSGFTLSHGLALDGIGVLHLIYADLSAEVLIHAQCAASCSVPTSWDTTTIDPAVYVGAGAAIVAGNTGDLHVLYSSSNDSDLRYATCPAACDQPGNWVIGVADSVGTTGGLPALGLDANGTLHAAQYDFSLAVVRYLRCSSGCDTPAGWTRTTVGATGIAGFYPSLVLGVGGSVHLTFTTESPNNLYYATCQTSCTSPTAWTRTLVDGGASAGAEHGFAQGPDGRFHISYLKVNTQDLNYASCIVNCTDPANWRRTSLDTAGNVGAFSSIAVDGSGRFHVAYQDQANGFLKYAR